MGKAEGGFGRSGRGRPDFHHFLRLLLPGLCRGLVSGLVLLSWESPCTSRWATGRLVSQGTADKIIWSRQKMSSVSPSHTLSLDRKGLHNAIGVGVSSVNQSREASALGLLLARWEGPVHTLAPSTTVPASHVL